MFRTLALALVAFAAITGASAEDDAEGGADYPGLGRFAGSVITGYEVRDFDDVVFQAKAYVNEAPADQRTVEGKVSRIAYRAAEGASSLEVFRNFTNKAAGLGYQGLLECETDACGGGPFAYNVEALPLPQMMVDPFSYRYFSAHRPAGATNPESYLIVVVSESSGTVFAQVTVIEVGALEDKMVDAAAMKKGLSEAGHIALYGIYFDTGAATIKAESAPTLAEIAKLLKANAGLQTVYIVGHTDSQGAYDYNMDLSRRRAEAVAAALAADHGIAASRMKTAGAGFLAPIGSNATEAGRALNRRVELVQP